MGKCVIEKESVSAPNRCHLILNLDESKLGVAIVDMLTPVAPIWREIELSTAINPSQSSGVVCSSAERLVKALEEAVYDNPMLLSGFESVTVLLNTSWFTMLPAEICDAESIATVAENSMPEEAADAAMIEVPVADNATPRFVMFADVRLVNFLRRTFSNPYFHHPLEAMSTYFSGTDPLGVSGKMLAHFTTGHLDLMAFGDHGVRFANTFTFVEPADAVYFILAVRTSLDIDVAGELLLVGDAAAREAVTPIIRKYVGFAMPLPLQARIAKGPSASLPFPIEAAIANLLPTTDK
jgi:hypothetical protein